MTKQGAHGDHFLAFLILNVVASGFSMSWAEAAACARADLAGGLGFLREEMVTWFTVAGEALQVPAHAEGGIRWPKTRLFGTAPCSSPCSGVSSIVTGPRDRSVTLYFENTLWWQLNINMGNHSLRAVSTLHGACKSFQSASQLKYHLESCINTTMVIFNIINMD